MSEPPQVPARLFSRREWIVSVGTALGLTVTAAALPLLTSCEARPPQGTAETGRQALISWLSEAIIPRTDTPGAIDTGTPAFVARFLEVCASTEDRKTFSAGLAKLDAVAKMNKVDGFLGLPEPDRISLLRQMDAGTAPFAAEDKAFFSLLKSMVLLGYYTSEVGATQELSFLPIPGGYHGDVAFSTVGKAWSLP